MGWILRAVIGFGLAYGWLHAAEIPGWSRFLGVEEVRADIEAHPAKAEVSRNVTVPAVGAQQRN